MIIIMIMIMLMTLFYGGEHFRVKTDEPVALA